MPHPLIVSPAPRGVWHGLLEQQGPTPIESTPAWMDCITTAGHHVDASRLYRFGDGRTAVVPLASPRVGGRRAPAASLPFDWGFGGVVTGASALAPEEVDAVLDDLAGLPALRTRLAFPPGTAAEWAELSAERFVTGEKMVQVVDLQGGMDAVLGRFEAKRRWAVRRAERAGVEIEVDRSGRRLNVFFEMFDRSIERWAEEQGEPLALCRFRNYRANSRAKLECVARVLGERCAVWTAWVDGRPAGALITLRNGAHETEWKSAADTREFSRTRAMDLLVTHAIADACAAGALTFDMGESRPDSALAQFKSGFGALGARVHLAERERLPLRRVEDAARNGVKRAIGFRDR